mgnify:CR=1 FL=1
MLGDSPAKENRVEQRPETLPLLSTKWLTIVALLVVVLAFVSGRFILYAFREMEAVVSRVPDDVGYFYKIALNVVSDKGLTFDGINATNGFQPLWLYMLLPLARTMRDSPVDLYLRAALIYQLVLVTLAGVVFFSAMSLISRRSVALAATALFYIFGTRYLANGMETGALVLCLGLLLYFSLKYRPFSGDCTLKHAFLFGLLLGITVLARLDTVYLVAIIYTFLLWKIILYANHAERIHIFKQFAVSICSVVLVTAPYLVYNNIHFGSVMPISGQLKNSFPHILQANFGTERFPSAVFQVLAFIGIATLTSAFLSLRQKRASSAPERYTFIILVIGTLYVILHYLHTALFMKWGVFRWHFAFYFFHASLLFGYVLDRFVNRLSGSASRLSITAISLALFIVLSVLSYWTATTGLRGWEYQSYQLAVWVRNNLPQDARLALKDTGLFGLLSERSVVNLDGLVNNLEYQEYLRKRQLNEYLRLKGVQYLVRHLHSARAPEYEKVVNASYEYLDFPYRSYLYDTFSEPVRVYREDEVYRSPLYQDGQHRAVYVIWKLRYRTREDSSKTP